MQVKRFAPGDVQMESSPGDLLTERERVIWLAAILEGEGSFVVIDDKRGQRRSSLRVSLQMTDHDVIERVASLVPSGSRVHMVSRPSRPRDATCYAIQWHGQAAEDLMRRVLPFMGQRRKAKITECLLHGDLSHHGLSVRNTSGYLGVSWDRRYRKWKAVGRLDGKQHHLGYFHSAEEADAVARAWRARSGAEAQVAA